MEKIIHLIHLQDGVTFNQLQADVSGTLSELAEKAGGYIATLHTADLDDWIKAECETRQIGNVASVSAVLSIWLPSAHLAEPITQHLQSISQQVHAYLVSEAVWQTDENSQPGLQPGVNLVGCIKRNSALDDTGFFRHWDEHSVNSFSLHPLRQTYTRHAIVRPLTEDAPDFDGIVFEHFPSREVFADDQQFFDVEFAQSIAVHTMQLIDVEAIISNGMSEYRYSS